MSNLRFDLRALLLAICCASLNCVKAANVVVLGDSLSAEYELIPDFPASDNPTDYARITVAGWESMSWVEVLARLRPEDFNFGRHRKELPGWRDLRFTGYEFNCAIPGFTAAQFEDIVNSSLFSKPLYLPYRAVIQDLLKSRADRVVIWLGANEFRSNFGFLANGGDPASLIAKLSDHLDEVIQFVKKQRSNLQIVVANIPDLGAAPDKRNAHPDPVHLDRVTAATRQANEVLAALAVSRGVALADVYSQTERRDGGVPAYFGAIALMDEMHPDNHPRYRFTRDGLHPNTCSQIEIARLILQAFNQHFEAGIPQITDAEALKFLGINPRQPYFDWIARYRLSQSSMEDDPDRDGMANVVEMAFGLDPAVPDESPVTARVESGQLKLHVLLDANHERLLKVAPERSTDLRVWRTVDDTHIANGPGAVLSVSLPIASSEEFVRFSVTILDP